MKKICVFFIEIIITFFLVTAFTTIASGQDTVAVVFPLKINIGADIYGPAYYYAEKNSLTIEGFISVDRDTMKSYSFEAGYSRFNYEQYNYSYKCKGFFIRAGIDFNFISPKVSKGRYYAGTGLKYGASLYSHEIPFFESENFWGKLSQSIGKSTHIAHFIEASPGIRTELFKNFSIGWTIRLRILLYGGTGKDLKPIYIPGYGNGTKSFSPGINYYFVWSIPYKKVTLKPAGK